MQARPRFSFAFLLVFFVLFAGLGLGIWSSAPRTIATAQDQGEDQGASKSGNGRLYDGEAVKILLVTGGCCHNYLFQGAALTEYIDNRANVEWTIVNKGGNGTAAMIDLYKDAEWAKPFDLVIHNECFAKTTDADYIRSITEAHRAGTPAVVIHCAMHTYRDAQIDDWREFLGVTSRKHEHKAEYPVRVAGYARNHPVMGDFPDRWTTPSDELYVIEKLWPGAKGLAFSTSEKTGETHPVIWVNDFDGTRVMGTTYGHSDDTFRDKVFLEVLTRGALWAAGKLDN